MALRADGKSRILQQWQWWGEALVRARSIIVSKQRNQLHAKRVLARGTYRHERQHHLTQPSASHRLHHIPTKYIAYCTLFKYISIYYIHTTHICMKNPKSVNRKLRRYDVYIIYILIYYTCAIHIIIYIIFIVACVLIYKYISYIGINVRWKFRFTSNLRQVLQQDGLYKKYF